jgi:hypothetical protein
MGLPSKSSLLRYVMLRQVLVDLRALNIKNHNYFHSRWEVWMEYMQNSSMLSAVISKNVTDFGKYDNQGSRFAVIDSRKLERECFVRVIKASHARLSITAYGSVQEWSEGPDREGPCVILLNIGGRRVGMPTVASSLQRLVAEAGDTPVIVLSESEDLRDMIAAIDCGARGYIPASVGVDVIIDAACLTSAGGDLPSRVEPSGAAGGDLQGCRPPDRDRAALHLAPGGSGGCAAPWQSQQEHRL